MINSYKFHVFTCCSVLKMMFLQVTLAVYTDRLFKFISHRQMMCAYTILTLSARFRILVTINPSGLNLLLLGAASGNLTWSKAEKAS